jgi:hypothetical protein
MHGHTQHTKHLIHGGLRAEPEVQVPLEGAALCLDGLEHQIAVAFAELAMLWAGSERLGKSQGGI